MHETFVHWKLNSKNINRVIKGAKLLFLRKNKNFNENKKRLKMKSKIKIGLMGLLLSVMLLATMTTASACTVNTPTERLPVFSLHEGGKYTIEYYPHEKGSRTFEIWYDTMSNPRVVGNIQYAWTNNGGKTWTPFSGGGTFRYALIGNVYQRIKQVLYSGSSNIGYRIIVSYPVQKASILEKNIDIYVNFK